jgi:phytoene dehydrogenase-like protein
MIAIIGSGLAGLTAARELKASGYNDFVIFEQNHDVGGRIRSVYRDGFILDRGFQVLNPAYKILGQYIDPFDLELGFFDSGAMLLRHDGEAQPLRDPLKNLCFLGDAFKIEGVSLKDLILIGFLRAVGAVSSEPGADSNLKFKTKEAIEKLGFSSSFKEKFLYPFFAGVFLDQELSVPNDFFLYLFGLFGKHRVGLPKQGMGALPKLLARPLLENQIRLNTEVGSLKSCELHLTSGEKVKADAVILATNPAQMINLHGLDQKFSHYQSATTLYFSANELPWEPNMLGLVPWRHSLVNHISIQSLAQPSYAPEGKHLISVNVLESEFVGQDASNLANQVLEELKSFNINGLKNWELLEAEHIFEALPSNFQFGKTNFDRDGVFLASDFLENPSIGGAMLSGQKAANRVLNWLSKL